MKAIKKINNNVVICTDSNNNELIAMGKGVGFGDFPRELSLSDIQRTFYDLDEAHLMVMKDLPDDVVLFAGKIVDMAKNVLDAEFSGNVVLTMADHLAFTIYRCRNNIKIKMPLAYDIEQYYPKEYKIAEYTIDRLAKIYNLYVPKSEIYGVAMILINGQVECFDSDDEIEEVADEITRIVEDYFHIIVDRHSFNYSRFATHLHYLLDRLRKGEAINTDNGTLLSSIKPSYPEAYDCAEKISDYLMNNFKKELSDEEKLYLVLHINRVCAKEGI
ncbi:MAG: PRD domain-containing protein [Erysipelotrichaceae bacterium]